MKLFSLVFVAASVAALSACRNDDDVSGQLVVSIASDMALPQQIDTIQMQVQVHGLTLLDTPYDVGTGDNPIPATLTLLAGKSGSQPVTIRVAGRKGDAWRTFREVTTVVPPDHTALLRMPVQWLCDGTARSVSTPDGTGGTDVHVLSTCDDGNTCIAGRCIPSTIDNSSLPSYAGESVFGGSSDPKQGRCFDTIACMIKGAAVQPDEHCTIAKPDGDAPLNVALRVANDGICDPTGTVCFVPLDGHSAEGWTPTVGGDRLALPQAVCDKQASGAVRAVYLSAQCDEKTESIPPCGQWSSVPNDRAIEPNDASAPSIPIASVIESLLPADGSAGLCCPLMTDGTELYACICASGSAPRATVLAIDKMVQGRMDVAAQIDGRNLSGAVTAISGNALYWIDGAMPGSLQRTTLAGAQSQTTTLAAEGIFAQSSVLADAAGLYFLAQGVGKRSPVQFVELDAGTNTTTQYDTGANKVVYQFDQDDRAVYLARDIDTAADGGGSTRKSAVLRIAKSDGQSSAVLAEQSVAITNVERGGYIRIRRDADAVYGLFEGPAQADGTETLELHEQALVNGVASGDPKLTYALSLDPTQSQLDLLGAVDGAAVLSRADYQGAGHALSSASLLVVPADGSGLRAIADFADDAPAPGLVIDDDSLYWVNTSGRLYKVSRDAVRSAP